MARVPIELRVWDINLINLSCYLQPQRLETAANVAKSAYAD